MKAPEVCVGAVVVDHEHLLLVCRGRPPGKGYWSVPGGRVEAGETLAEAIVREVAEETGLEAVCGELLGLVERITDEHHFVILDFAATVLDRRPPEPGDDAADAAWVAVNDVAERRLVDGLAEFLHERGVIPTIT